MKFGIVVLMGIMAAQANAATFPEGKYIGKALWKTETTQGAYNVKTTFVGETVSSNYTLEGGKQMEWKFEMQPTSNGFFNVVVNGTDVGSGYCLDKVLVCHYEANLGSLKLEETMTVEGGKLYKFGSKEIGTDRVVWQEELIEQ